MHLVDKKVETVTKEEATITNTSDETVSDEQLNNNHLERVDAIEQQFILPCVCLVDEYQEEHE